MYSNNHSVKLQIESQKLNSKMQVENVDHQEKHLCQV